MSLNVDDIKSLIDKGIGPNACIDLRNENLTDVTQWISTGSTWVDLIIAKGKKAGIPVGKIVELAGDHSAGKSFMAANIAVNAQKMGITPIYFDSEMAVDSVFLENMGLDLNNFVYVAATDVETVFETIDLLMAQEGQFLFIWDSLALTPTRSELQGGYNPQSDIARKARIINLCLSRIVIPLARSNNTLLVLNQLKTKIGAGLYDPEKFVTPGGKSLTYAYSLRLWLTPRLSKAGMIKSDDDKIFGTETKLEIKKSRFGSYGRTCPIKMIWGSDTPHLCDEELWYDALKETGKLVVKGAGYCTLSFEDGSTEKFRSNQWDDLIKDEKFREKALLAMQEGLLNIG